MIDVKEAVRVALAAVRELYAEGQVPHLTPEEVELDKDGTTWVVIVSFARPFAKSTIEAMTGQTATTTYKRLEIDAATGVVRAMKMHQV